MITTDDKELLADPSTRRIDTACNSTCNSLLAHIIIMASSSIIIVSLYIEVIYLFIYLFNGAVSTKLAQLL